MAEPASCAMDCALTLASPKKFATKRLRFACLASFALAGLALLPSCKPAAESVEATTKELPQLERFTFREPHLGTHAGLVFYAPDKAVANRAAAAAYERIRELDAVFSTYRDDSELQRLCRHPQAGNGVRVSDDLGSVLTTALELSRQSKGAFDVTVGPTARIWKRAIRQKRMPDKAVLKQAMQSVGYEHVRLETTSKKIDDKREFQIALLRPDMQIDLAGIAKGYIADAALAVLVDHDCKSALVDLGGDLAIGDPPPGKPGWRVAMATGERQANQSPDTITLHNCGLATSGDTFQHLEIDGKRFSHIVDARTGQATTESLTVTVISPTSVMADALASTVSVLGAQRGRDFLQKVADSEASILPRQPSGSKTPQRLTTDGFPPCETPTTVVAGQENPEAIKE